MKQALVTALWYVGFPVRLLFFCLAWLMIAVIEGKDASKSIEEVFPLSFKRKK